MAGDNVARARGQRALSERANISNYRFMENKVVLLHKPSASRLCFRVHVLQISYGQKVLCSPSWTSDTTMGPSQQVWPDGQPQTKRETAKWFLECLDSLVA